MSEYINEIWHADMKQNGLTPLIKDLSDHEGNLNDGYVIVDMNPFPNRNPNPSDERQVNVLKKVVIPDHKIKSYELFKALHDNYNWRKNQDDPTPQQEWEEVDKLLQFAITTEPMKIARKFAEKKEFISSNSPDEEWINQLKALWFKQYEDNSTSLFEHVFIGEQGGRNRDDDGYSLGGHHFWYHYHINDGPFEMTNFEDNIVFLKHVEVTRLEKSNKAEVITIEYNYTKKDEHGEEELYKFKGGFFVGVSVEGLLAIGTVAFLVDSEDTDVKIEVALNEEVFDLIVWRTRDRFKNPRTFFPQIKSAVPVR